MTQATTLIENEALQKVEESLSHSTTMTTHTPLHVAAREFLQHYFLQLENTQFLSI